MSITQITEENASKYTDYIPAETISDLSRSCCRGMALEAVGSDEPDATMVWMLKNLEDDNNPTRAQIIWFGVFSEEDPGALFDAFFESIKSEGAVNAFFEFEDLEPSEKSYFEKAGFNLGEAESRDICVTVGDMGGLGLGQKDPPPYIKSLSSIGIKEFRAGVMASVFHGRYGLLDDLPFLPMGRYEPEISSCVITDGKVDGLLLVHKTLSEKFIVELLFAMKPDADLKLIKMMRRSVRAAVASCNKDDIVILRRHNQMSADLVKKLFPDKTGVIVMRGEKDVK